MKKSLFIYLQYIFVSALFVTPSGIYAQASCVNFEWAKQAAANANNVHGLAIATDAAGNSYVTGHFEGTASFGSTTLTSAGNRDIFIAKLDANGNYLWARRAGGGGSNGGSDEGYGIAVDMNGNCYITGMFRGTASLGSFTLVSASSHSPDIFIAKLNAAGNFLWAKGAGGSGMDYGYAITVDASGNSYVTGEFRGSAIFGATTLASTGSSDVFITKLDVNGNFLWASRAGGNSGETGNDIAIDASGNSYIIGHFGSGNPATFGTTTLTSAGGPDVFIAKLSTTGSFLWARRVGGIYSDHGHGIAVDAAGNCYATGEYQGAADFGTTTLNTTGGVDSDAFIVKLNTNGTFLWARRAGGTSGYDRSHAIAVDATGNSYISGEFMGTAAFGSFTLVSAGAPDVFAAKLDANGNYLWAKQAGGSGGDYSFGISLDAAGNSYITGHFSGATAYFGGTTFTSTTFAQAFVSKIKEVTIPVFAPINAICEGGVFLLPATSQNGITGAWSPVVNNMQSTTYTFTPNTGQCATSTTMTVVVNAPTSFVLNVTHCGAYTLNSQTYTSTGTYTHVIPNANNCDSTITLNLTINQPTSSSVNITECNSYTWALNNQTYTATGTYTHVVQNANNCDSTITLNLAINQPTSSSVNITECNSYTWPLNSQTYTATGTYTHVIPNANSCDSTVTLNLTINQPTSSSANITECDSYTWPLNSQTYTATGTYTHVIPNANNCDSTVTLNLTINQSTSSSVNITECNLYTWALNNQTYTATGTYTHVVQNTNNCDSTVTLNLTINNVDNNVSVSGITLTANQTGATYQWIDCNNGNPISGATAQSFEPVANGNYAVEVTANGCTETSNCIAINSVGIATWDKMVWNVYPNPANEQINISLFQPISNATIYIIDICGRLIYHEKISGTTFSINIQSFSKGTYFLNIADQTNVYTGKFVKD